MNSATALRAWTRSLSLALFALIFSCLLTSCGPSRTLSSDNHTLRIKGSDTMLLLAIRWAEAFMAEHPEVAVYVEGGGSATGIRALINGDVDFCTSSRPIIAEEARMLLERCGSLGISILTAKDALSVYLHPDNPVRNLTLEQLRGLFTGKISRWSMIGGADLPVQVISRSPNSGTFFFFEEHVLKGDPYSDDAVTEATTPAIIRQVRSDPGAIGYGGVAYGESGVVYATIEGVEPTAENVRNGSYPISRYLYFYAATPPRGLAKTFVDWVLSSEGQAVVKEIGYIPLWESESSEGSAR